MTTYDKETYAKLAEWAKSQSDKHSALGLERDEITNLRNDLAKEMHAKFPLINAYKKTGELDESLLPIIDGIPHEADNIHNGGDIVPSGVGENPPNIVGVDLARPDSGITVETEIDTTTGEVVGARVWRDDVPDESKADGEETMVEQEAHDHGGIVVEGDGWERNMGSNSCLPMEKIESLVLESGYSWYSEEQTMCNFDWELNRPNSIAWYKLKDVADEQETIVEGSQEKPAEEDQTEATEGSSIKETDDTVSDSASTNGYDGNGNGDDGHGQADKVEHPTLEYWIMQQEWIHTDGSIIFITAIVDKSVEFIEDGSADQPEYDTCYIGTFLSEFTPKGWERFDPEFDYDTRPDDLFDIFFADGEQIVEIEGMGIQAIETKPIFIREHKEETNDTTAAELEAGEETEEVPEEVSAPSSSTSSKSLEDVSTANTANSSERLQARDGDVEGETPTSSEENELPMGSGSVSNGSVDSLDPPNQQAVDLVEGRVGDELDKLEGVAE